VVAHLAAFFGVSALVIVTPGQDTALTIRNTVLGGRSGGIGTAFGVCAGQAIWALAASAGLAAVLHAFEPGLQILRRRSAEPVAGRRGTPFRQGLPSNLGNPKMVVFFTSLLPQFASSFPALLGLGLVFSGMTLTWLTAYAAAVAKAGDLLRRSRVRRAIDAVTGAVLVALGLRLAAERV